MIKKRSGLKTGRYSSKFLKHWPQKFVKSGGNSFLFSRKLRSTINAKKDRKILENRNELTPYIGFFWCHCAIFYIDLYFTRNQSVFALVHKKVLSKLSDLFIIASKVFFFLFTNTCLVIPYLIIVIRFQPTNFELAVV